VFPFQVISVTPKLPEAVGRLRELAYNLWFSWDPRARELFRKINGDLYEEVGQNPVKFLMRVHEDDLEAVGQNEEYLKLYRNVFERFDAYLNGPFWFTNRFPDHAGHTVAYFSAEFGLHESHPIYSGGLGLLAGDHCKAASDLGLPFVGVGILYRHGYFTQKINREGWQEADYPELNFFELPMAQVTNEDGGQLTVPVDFPGRKVYLQVWRVAVGRVNIYLLDADHPRNSREDRRLTGQLYGGDREYRLAQEIILGVGGVRALRALGIQPYVWSDCGSWSSPASSTTWPVRRCARTPFSPPIRRFRPGTTSSRPTRWTSISAPSTGSWGLTGPPLWTWGSTGSTTCST